MHQDSESAFQTPGDPMLYEQLTFSGRGQSNSWKSGEGLGRQVPIDSAPGAREAYPASSAEEWC